MDETVAVLAVVAVCPDTTVKFRHIMMLPRYHVCRRFIEDMIRRRNVYIPHRKIHILQYFFLNGEYGSPERAASGPEDQHSHEEHIAERVFSIAMAGRQAQINALFFARTSLFSRMSTASSGGAAVGKAEVVGPNRCASWISNVPAHLDVT